MKDRTNAKVASAGALALPLRQPAAGTWRNPGLLVTLGLIALVGLWPAITGQEALRETIFTIMLSVALASSLNVMLGYTGYINFGNVVFFGLGGYMGMFLLGTYGSPLWIAMLAGGGVSGLLALLLGKAILRLRGSYFALATIGVSEVARTFIGNFAPFGGPTGISLNFRIFAAYGGAKQALWLTYYVLIVLAMAVITVSYLIKTSKFGLGLMAIREDEGAAEVMGVVTPSAKTWAYIASAIFPGMIGVLVFFRKTVIEPDPAFDLQSSIETLVTVMLGGRGTVVGPALGAAGYQGLRGFLMTNPFFQNIQLSVAGVLLLIIVLFIPTGVVGWLRARFPRLRGLLP